MGAPLTDARPLATAGRFVHEEAKRENAHVPKAITFCMPPEMAEQVLKEEGGAMSEFLRDAIRLYMEERECRQRAEARRNDQE